MPTLVVAGDADSIIPIDQSRAVYDAAPGSKDWLVVPGAAESKQRLAVNLANSRFTDPDDLTDFLQIQFALVVER